MKKKKKAITFNLSYLIKVIGALLLLSFVLYVTYRTYRDVTMRVTKTQIIDLGEVKKIINKDVVIVRKSTPVVSKRDGVVTRFYNQGDRVPKNAVIFKVQDAGTPSNEIAELEKLNLEIEQMQKNSSYMLDIQSNKLGGDIDYIYMEIQESIKNNKLNKVAKLKSELSLLNDRKKAVNSDLKSGLTLEELYNRKATLEKKISTDNTYIRSNISGELSYYYDEYYDLFSYDNIKNISVSDISSAKNNVTKLENQNVKTNDIIGYIVDNHNYYMATQIQKEDIENIKRDVALGIMIGDVSFNAYFSDFYKDKNGKFVGLFKVESEDFDFLKNRKENVDIVFNKAKGILIPNTAITDLDGKKGVYVVDSIGVAKFCPLDNVLLSDEKYTVVQFSYDDIADENKIKLYDEVVISPTNIKSGQKVK